SCFVLGLLELTVVLDGAAHEHDLALSIALYFASAGDCPDGAVGTNHLQVEFVRRSRLDGGLYGGIQSRRTLRCVEPEMFFVCGRGQHGITLRNMRQSSRPSDAVRLRIPPPPAHASQALCFSQLHLPSM